MNLRINGKNETLESPGLTVTGLLDVKQVPDPDMVSVQLNGDILERDTFGEVRVKDGDELEFLYFMGGGSGRRSRRFASAAAAPAGPFGRR